MNKYVIHSLVFSRIIYCCSLLSDVPVNLIYKLERIQRRTIYNLHVYV